MDDYIQGNLFMSEQNSQEELQPNTKKTLTLKKEALTNLKNESLAKLKKEALDKLRKEDLAKAAENFKEVKKWLETTYPKSFNFQSPIPLKKGIRQELLAKGSPFSEAQLCNALTGYVRNDSYLKAVVEGQWRHDLNGQQTEEILENEKEYSREFLLYREEKRRSRKEQTNSEGEKVRESQENNKEKE
jgi:ProP effector